VVTHTQTDQRGPRRQRRRAWAKSTILLAQGADPYAVSVARCRLSTRLLARVRSLDLDRSLAAGAQPDSSALLSLRAGELQSAAHRRRLADGFRRRLAASRRDAHPFDRQIPLARAEIRRCAALVDELVDALESAVPADLRGIARASLLLCEGNSPLYAGASTIALEPVLREAIDALSLAPSVPAPK
jgi:hypothetical protein